MNKPIIIGAGIAGLSAANHLIDNNIQPIIIEGDTIGRMKICGEFFSPEAIPFLQNWNIPIISIKRANFFTPNFNYSYNMPYDAASVSRSMCELQLKKRAIEKGTQIYENTFVTKIIPAQDNNDIHYIKLSNGQILETNKLIVATGKIASLDLQNKLTAKYVGIKTHFTNINIPNELHMFIIDGAYMGVTFIDDKTINVCCLAKKNLIDKYKDHEEIIKQFINKYPVLNDLNNATQVQSWLTAYVPNFGKKTIPTWPNTYFIGDAAATIFPASGNGLTMGLTSAIMAAQYILNTQDNFRHHWNVKYKSRLHYAKILNYLFLKPNYATLGFKIANKLPFISNLFYKLTRE